MNIKETIKRTNKQYKEIAEKNNTKILNNQDLRKWIAAWEEQTGAAIDLELDEVITDIKPALIFDNTGYNKNCLYHVLTGYYTAKKML